MTLRVAQFSLKIAHLCFSMVLRGPRACGLRPRLWLLMDTHCKFVACEVASDVASCVSTFKSHGIAFIGISARKAALKGFFATSVQLANPLASHRKSLCARSHFQICDDAKLRLARALFHRPEISDFFLLNALAKRCCKPSQVLKYQLTHTDLRWVAKRNRK